MEEKTDIVVDQEKVKRLIIKILLDESFLYTNK